MIARMEASETMAVVRLKQWCFDRSSLLSSRTTNYKRRGWQRRNERSFDARNVRVIDFERVLDRLSAEEQAALVMRYRDGETADSIAQALDCSVRKIDYLVKCARQKLATSLDRVGLL